jgi:hypothetical protein
MNGIDGGLPLPARHASRTIEQDQHIRAFFCRGGRWSKKDQKKNNCPKQSPPFEERKERLLHLESNDFHKARELHFLD